MRLQPRWCSGSLPSTMAVRLAFALCLVSRMASADLLLAPSDLKIPFSGFDQLQAVCTAVQVGSTPVAMYTTAMTSLVENLMLEKKVDQVYVSAYLNADRKWLWFVYDGGQATTTLVDSRQWASGNPTGPHTTYRYAAYSTTDRGLISIAGYDTYPVVCSYEKKLNDNSPKKFPWWGVLIIVLSVAVALVVVAVCCCCCKKKHDDAEEETSEFSIRTNSFSSRGITETGSSKSDGSSSFFVAESQRDSSSSASRRLSSSPSNSTPPRATSSPPAAVV